MKRGDSESTKLIVVPSSLVERLKTVATMQGIPLSKYIAEAMEETLRADGMGISLSEAVDLYHLMQVQRGASPVFLPRSSFEHLIRALYPAKEEELKKIWFESGRWYGEYLRTKLKDDNVVNFFEKALLISWDLDEVEIKNDNGGITLRCTSFTMSLESTDLLIRYISGVMSSFGYAEKNKDYLRGMATIKYEAEPGRKHSALRN